MTPTEASKNEALLLAQEDLSPSKATKYNLGEKVRISRIKGVFEQGYLPNWSEELFEIVKVKNTNPTTYVLKDANSERNRRFLLQ